MGVRLRPTAAERARGGAHLSDVNPEAPQPPASIDLGETLVERRTVFSGRLLTVHLDRVRLPGGAEATREVVAHPGAVAIVAADAEGRVLLVRQWRHAVGGAVWEIPAGTREPGEAPTATAVRELREETGYTAGVWRSLGRAAVSPGYSSEILHFFAATDLRPGLARGDDDERLEARLFTAAEISVLVENGGTDCKTLAGLALSGLLPEVVR